MVRSRLGLHARAPLGLAAVVLLAAGACGSDSKGETADASSATSTAPPASVADTTGDGARPSTTATASSVPATTVPVDPCQPRGYVIGPSGEPIAPGSDQPFVAVEQLEGRQEHVYTTDQLTYDTDPESFVPRSFDWDADGEPDRVSADPALGAVSVHTGVGTVTVTGVRTDFGDVGHYSSIHSALPLEVGDVTGDGRADLIVASRGSVAVLVGAGDRTSSTSVAFDRIGVDVAGWITPPVRTDETVAPALADKSTLPWSTATPGLYDDLDGDGLDDIVLYNHAERSRGPSMLLLGQPCPAT